MMKHGLGAALLAAIIASPVAVAAEAPKMDPGLRAKARHATDLGLRFLRANMAKDGSWVNSVGVTAIALRAYLESHRGYGVGDGPFITRPIAFILKHVRPDGSISETIQNRNYNTALSITALQATKDPAYARIIRNGQKFLKGLQLDETNGYAESHKYYGGMGYGGDERPDLSNQYFALEALKATSLDPADPVWKKALVFVSRAQNLSETNDQKWAANDGGFTYMPGYSPHGGTGSYGSMTYAGLISLIFAGVDKKDPRIQGAYRWIKDNYTLEEHPGVKGKQGLFYYYSAFAKTMYAYGKTEITDAKGVTHNWRNDFAAKLVGLQAADGSWSNAWSKRWWEGVKPLQTARMVISLSLAAR